MPIREDAQALSPRIYRTLKFGDLVDLILLDTRLVGRDEQVSRDDIAAIDAPGRSFSARAGGLASRRTERVHAVRNALADPRAAGDVCAADASGRPAGNPDSWDGYRASRDRVFDMIEHLKVDTSPS